MLEDKDAELIKLKGGKAAEKVEEVKSSSSFEKPNAVGIEQPNSVDKDYLRNVLVRYLGYIATGEDKEAITLEKVLFTVLDAKPADLKSLQDARQKHNTGLLGYFYSKERATAKPLKLLKNKHDISMEFD
jgi:hypothetical protein